MTTVSLVGSTGSIGTQALDVIRSQPDRYQVLAIGASTSVELLVTQAREFRPALVAIADRSLAGRLERELPAGTEVWVGPEAMSAIAGAADVVVNGVVGFVGLKVTLVALRAGRRLALANKESLIAGGPVVQQARQTPGAEIVPIDSEHCAVHQCVRSADSAREVARIVLTASGGPFRGRTAAELAHATVEEALVHPTWAMGPKITIDSSTLMNKGLEVIEAHELFGLDYSQIGVVVHPQSIVHSMVEFIDGATMAQLSQPDMRLPIAYALGYPNRSPVPYGSLDWSVLQTLSFEPPDRKAFPCLSLAYAAGRTGGTAPAWLNAANEVAVSAVLKGLMPWSGIAEVIEETLADHDGTIPTEADVVIEADRLARERAERAVERRSLAA